MNLLYVFLLVLSSLTHYRLKTQHLVAASVLVAVLITIAVVAVVMTSSGSSRNSFFGYLCQFVVSGLVLG